MEDRVRRPGLASLSEVSVWLVTALAALHQMVSAVNAGDARQYASLYAPNAVITIYGGDTLAGREAIERYEVSLLHEFPGTRLAFYDIWQSGDRAVVHYGVNGPTPNGPMGHEGLLFYRFDRDGVILEERRYLDSMTPMAQMGAFGRVPRRALPVLPDEMKSHSQANGKNIALVKTALKNVVPTVSNVRFDELMLPTPFEGAADAWRSATATVEITNTIGVGDFVLAEMIVRGTLNGTLGRVTASNKPFEVHRAAIVEVRDGRIATVRAFMNGKELAQVVGQWPPRPSD